MNVGRNVIEIRQDVMKYHTGMAIEEFLCDFYFSIFLKAKILIRQIISEKTNLRQLNVFKGFFKSKLKS